MWVAFVHTSRGVQSYALPWGPTKFFRLNKDEVYELYTQVASTEKAFYGIPDKSDLRLYVAIARELANGATITERKGDSE